MERLKVILYDLRIGKIGVKAFCLGLILCTSTVVLAQSTWNGNNSTNWFDNGNWTGGIPNQNDNVTIPNGTPNNPNLTGIAECAQITINGTLTISAGGELSVYGDFTNSGAFIDNGGILIMTGTSASILNSTPMSITELRIENWGGVTVSGGMVTILDELQVNRGSLNTGNLITLRSDATGTARIAELNHSCNYRLNMQTIPWFFGFFNFWFGASVNVLEDGVSLGTFADAGGGTVVDIPIVNGANITLNYTTGFPNNNYSYSFLDPSGTPIFSDGPGPTGGNVFTTTATCPYSDPITGEITMERYIDAGATYWRYFGSAVQNPSMAQFNDDFKTAGYPGSLYPNFGWVSAYNYDETLGPGLGYLACTGASQVMGVGEGWQIWCGDTITGTQSFNFDLTGVPNQGDINLPVSFTNTGTPSEDGFNLVCNPYPSAIDWEDPDWVKFNMANAVYIQDPDTEQYATYISGASTNGGSRYIASQQAFWVQATGAAPLLTATEGVKADLNPAFIKSSGPYSPGMKITLLGALEFDEAIVRHIDQSSDDFDPMFDALKFWGGWGQYPQLSLTNGQHKDLTVHSFDKNYQEWEIPMRAVVFQDGNYSIKFENVDEMDVPCMYLEDTYDGSMYQIYEGAVYQFYMDDSTYAERFLIHVGQEYELNTTSVSCQGDQDGEISIDLNDPSVVDYKLINGPDTIFASATANPLHLSGLEPGIYEIQVPTLTNLCGQTAFNAVVGEPSALGSNEIITHAAQGNDGMIQPQIYGGNPPYTYEWNTGEITETISGLGAGMYLLTVEDSKGCSFIHSYEVFSTLGNDENYSSATVYYNEFDNNVSIAGLVLDQEAVMILYSPDGKQITQYTLKPGVENHLLQIPANLAKGIYILGSETVSFKFQK